MSAIALDCGGTIDKFIGDAILVFFGDPETLGEEEDAVRAVEMALRMQQRVDELQGYWKKNGASRGLKVRMAIATGYCTVGNFGSERRLEYTALGGAVNLAARLQLHAPAGSVLVAETTHTLISDQIDCEHFDKIAPKGFARPVQVYRVRDFFSEEHRERRRRLSRIGDHVEVNVIDSSDIRAAIEELRRIQQEFEEQFPDH
jgi:class 3 adenylate cyclase